MQKIPIALAANGMVLAIGKDLGALPGLGVALAANVITKRLKLPKRKKPQQRPCCMTSAR